MLTNVRRERFAQALAGGASQAEAYRSAGYQDDPSHAARLARIGPVHARVRELRLEQAEAAKLSRQMVVSRLMRVADRAMQAVPVVDGKGQPTGEYRADFSAANRALELLGKELGMFVDQQETRELRYEISSEPLTTEDRKRMDDEWLASCSGPTEH